MKAKVILTSTAVLGLLTACSQDELGVVENNAPAKATTAPIAGKAVIKVANDGTRFNYELGAFEEGDKIGLYQMDEYQYEEEYLGNGDWAYYYDANTPENYWKKQNCWWALHTFTNSINTNYKYVMNNMGEFVNPGAELVEGNYFLLFDPETMANKAGHKPYANRRDLWKAIKKQVVLNDYTNTAYNTNGFGGLYGTLDNQFYLDYQQIYRNDETLNDKGELIIEAQLKPVLGKYTIDLVNESHTKYRFKEIRIIPGGEGFVPNIAYVHPADLWYDYSQQQDYSFVGMLYEKYPETYPNGKDAFTVEMARSIVEYDDVANGYVPYGYEGDKSVAAYYSVKFAEPAVIEAHQGSATLEQALEAIFVCPVWPNFNMSRIMVYADKYDVLAENADGTRGAWVPGYFQNDMFSADNKKWTVERTFDEVNKGRLYFDDNFFHTYAEFDGVMNTTDLYEHVQAVLESGYVANIASVVGKGVEINNELNDLINSYEKKYKKDIVLTIIPFQSSSEYDVAIVDEDLLASDNFDFSQFVNQNDVKVNILADQKLAEDQDLRQLHFGIAAGDEINLSLNGAMIGRVDNEGTLNVTSSGFLATKNTGVINVPAGVKVETNNMNNTEDGVINIDGEVINKFTNKSNFNNNGAVVLGKDAKVTIQKGKGTLDVSAIPVHTDGLQNHIEVVDPSEMTIIYNTAEGNLAKIEETLTKILAEHIIADAKEFAITSSAPELSGNLDALKEKATIVMTAGNVTIKAEDADYELATAVEFQGDLIIAGPKKVTLKDAVVKNVTIYNNVELAGTIAEFEGTITIYENGVLSAEIAEGKGTILGYTDQVTKPVPAGVKIFGNN